MLFCPNCQNLLNVSKTILAKDNVIDADTPQTVSQTTTEIKHSAKAIPPQPNLTNAYHICTTCYYYEPINKETLIISKNKENVTKMYVDYKLFKDSKYSPILPRTRAYICKNDQCKTHGNSEIKEAVFFKKNSEQMDTYYMCTVCDAIWKI
jgi:DNA-directed RNA polymerase subunit M/transcription elongation factor TFIIS